MLGIALAVQRSQGSASGREGAYTDASSILRTEMARKLAQTPIPRIQK